jgi:hypothetical protein
MAQFKIVSDNFALGAAGEIVSEEILDACNIAALIEGGHITEVSGKVKAEKETDK